MVLHVRAARLTHRLALAGVCAVCAGCEPVPANLIRSDVPLWGDSVLWQFDGEPRLVIGVDPEDPDAWLGAVQDARFLEAGRVGVTVPGLDQVRIYDAHGVLLHAFGSTGRSQGRFASIGSLWATRSAAIAVVSTRDGRVELFDTAGAPVRSIPLATPEGFVRLTPIGALPDGAIAAWAPTPHAVMPEAGTRLRDTLVVMRFDSSGTPVRRLAAVPGTRYVVFDDGGGARQIAAPFSSPAAVAVHPAGLLVAEDDRPGIIEIDPNGDTLRTIRWGPPTPVTEDLRQRYAAFLLAGTARDGGAAVGRFLDAAGFPAQLPAIRSILLDDRGFRWIEPWRLPWDTSSDWILLDPDGRWIGAIPMPHAFRPVDFRGSDVLGVLAGFDQSRRPAIFRLTRPWPPTS